MINLQCFVLVTKLHTQTQPLSRQTLSRIFSTDSYPNINQEPRHITRISEKLRCQKASCPNQGQVGNVSSPPTPLQTTAKSFLYNIEIH
jgi:hypothetical protein